MTLGKTVPGERYFIHAICVKAYCVFVWLSPGTGAHGVNNAAPSPRRRSVGCGQAAHIGVSRGLAAGQGEQAGAGGQGGRSAAGPSGEEAARSIVGGANGFVSSLRGADGLRRV